MQAKAENAPDGDVGGWVETPGAQLRRRLRHHSGFTVGALVLAVTLALALLAPWVAPHDPYAQDLGRRLIGPIWHANGDWAHPLGTDKFGRDYLSRLVYGARISLLIGFVTVLLSGVIGTLLGLVAGYFGGRVDAIILYLVSVRLSMPVVLVALAVVSLSGSSLLVIVSVLGLLLWDRFAVVVRTVSRRAATQDYVQAARAMGTSSAGIILREILPNVLNPIFVVGTLEMANAILLEAALSFLGLGVQPPLPSWGLMIAEAKEFIFFSPWMITIPGTALFVLVLGINLLGDGLRDVSAPEART
jgi:peptide/nickel transport system permease protein